ncbi:MAG: histidine kinase [Verrucomicrobiota bacterium]|nr:histidine kinase [Verrucomicrobiota bacterium]
MKPGRIRDKNGLLVLSNARSATPPESARPLRRRRMAWYCVIGWTIFAGLVLWWLLRGHAGPSVWIVNQSNPGPVAGAATLHAWFRAGMGFQRIIPWLLLGPYVAAAALGFPLERGRLRLNLPVNLAVCAAFLVACHVFDVRTRLTLSRVTIVRAVPVSAGWQTNTSQTIVKSGPAPATGWTNRMQDISSTDWTNWLVQLRQDFKFPRPPPGLPQAGIWSTLLDVLAYGALAGLAHSVHFYRRFRERERRALLLESHLANARLAALRMQLQPHFLFNSLNGVTALLRRDPHLAEATLLSLSELLRLALNQSEKTEIPLREEMEFVQRYLAILQTRFGDKLRVEQAIEPASLDCLVPTLLLQPLIENAIRHGIEPAEKAGLVRLTTRRRDGKLILTVEDDGAGLIGPDAASGRTGIGLANLRARLETLYGAGQALELLPRPEGGVMVRVEIPWRPASAPETSGPTTTP